MHVVCRAGQRARAREEREEVLEREWRERVREAERKSSARCQQSLRSLSQDRDKVSLYTTPTVTQPTFDLSWPPN